MTSFPRRRSQATPQALSALASLLDVPPPASELEIRGIAPLSGAGPRELGFLAHRRYLVDLEKSDAGALLVSSEMEAHLGGDERPRLVVEDAHRSLAVLLEAFHPTEAEPAEVHPTAIIGDQVQLGDEVRVAPYAVLEDGVVVGAGCSIGAHAVVGRDSRIGEDSTLHPHVVLYPGTVLGDRVIVHAGARIGVDGFGYVYQEGAYRKIPHIGGCELGNDVEVGANTTVDRGSIGDTRVGQGGKLDNLVQVGHNVTVGPHSILAGQAGVGGSTRIEGGVMVGGQAGIAGHVTIGRGARLAGQAGVTGDIPPGATVMGFPARDRTEFLRATAAQGRVPELLKRVRRLEGELARLLEEDGPPQAD